MSGPCCGDGCRFFHRAILGDTSHGECSDPAKVIFYKYGGAVNSLPEVHETFTCCNFATEDVVPLDRVGKPEVFAISVEEAAALNYFMQARMTDAESVEEIGLIATKLYHFCRENPAL